MLDKSINSGYSSFMTYVPELDWEGYDLIGNQYRRFKRVIGERLQPLCHRLEQAGVDPRPLFSANPATLADSFATVLSLEQDSRAAEADAGTLYAYHIIRQNLERISTLRRILPLGETRSYFFEEILLNAADNFLALNRAIIISLLDRYHKEMFAAGPPPEKFAICNVGAAYDQDDVDVAVIVEKDDPRVDSMMARLSAAMLKNATHLHFYLAEQMVGEQYAGTIDDYLGLLDKQLRNIVIISQVINTDFIGGDRQLFDEYVHKVADRYYHERGRNLYHEGFARGAIAEIHAVRNIVEDESAINPKDDVYRLIKITATAMAARYGLRERTTIGVLRGLAGADRANADLYESLRQNFAFTEMMRHLFNLVAAAGHTIMVGEPGFDWALDQVAQLLGYGVANRQARQEMIEEYNRTLEDVRKTALQLADTMLDRIREKSFFRKMLIESTTRPDHPQDVWDFLNKLIHYHQYLFHEDVIDVFVQNPAVAEHFVKSLSLMDRERRERAISDFISFLAHDLEFMLEFVTVLSRGSQTGARIAEKFRDKSLQLLIRPETIDRFSRTFAESPLEVNDYVETLSTEQAGQLVAAVNRSATKEEHLRLARSLDGLYRLHRSSSRYFRRFVDRIFRRYPEYVFNLTDDRAQEELIARLREGVVSDFHQKLRHLEDYFDAEMVRLALAVLSGKIDNPGPRYRDFSDRFITALFAAGCNETACQAFLSDRERMPADLGVYAAGGSAREEAFDNDYDFLIFTSSADVRTAQYYDSVVAKANPAIARRAISPQHRMIDLFGGYVATIDQMADYLAQGADDDFIDRSELLGCRLVFGSREFDALVEQKLIEPFIFARADDYIEKMLGEIADRRQPPHPELIDIKEDQGGLRDIQMAFLILRAKFKVRKPITSDLLGFLRRRINPKLIDEIAERLDYMLRLRYIYHLVVAYDDIIPVDALEELAEAKIFSGELADVNQLAAQIEENFSSCRFFLTLLMKEVDLSWPTL
jgi:GlnD PII-uridylyltransferase